MSAELLQTMAMQALNDGPRNQMFIDIVVNRRKAIHGIVMHAIREITGRDPIDEISDHEMCSKLGLETPLGQKGKVDLEWVAYHWQGREIIKVCAPEVHNGRDPISGKPFTRIHQKVLQTWKKDILRNTPGQKLDIVVVPK